MEERVMIVISVAQRAEELKQALIAETMFSLTFIKKVGIQYHFETMKDEKECAIQVKDYIKTSKDFGFLYTKVEVQ